LERFEANYVHAQKSRVVVGLWKPLRATCWLESMKSSSLISSNRSNSNLFCGSRWAFVLEKAGSKACLFTAKPNRGILPCEERTISESPPQASLNEFGRHPLFTLLHFTSGKNSCFFLPELPLFYHLDHDHDHDPPPPQFKVLPADRPSSRLLKRPSVLLKPSRWSQSRSVARLGHLFIKQEQWHWVRGRDKQPMKRHEQSSTC
jgi:hypothetical protein